MASNNPIVICFGYQSLLQKLITSAKMSKVPFDTQRSKLIVAKKHYAKHGLK
jgi:hypothetical protein